jgi:hypothetical protein
VLGELLGEERETTWTKNQKKEKKGRKKGKICGPKKLFSGSNDSKVLH